MQREPSVGIRLASMLLDHVFMCFIIIIPMIPLILNQPDAGDPDPIGGNFQLVFLGLMFLYFLKDSFGGRSIAKRILKLQVVDNTTGTPASVVRCFIRNIFIIIWLVEVIVVFFRPTSRIGDLVAGTRVAYYEPGVLNNIA